MANMIIRYKVMPDDSEVDINKLEKKVVDEIKNYNERIEIRENNLFEVGFGLKAIEVEFKIDENLGSEDLENKINELSDVGSVSVIKMDRL